MRMRVAGKLAAQALDEGGRERATPASRPITGPGGPRRPGRQGATRDARLTAATRKSLCILADRGDLHGYPTTRWSTRRHRQLDITAFHRGVNGDTNASYSRGRKEENSGYGEAHADRR